jgi:hypothetical protein
MHASAKSIYIIRISNLFDLHLSILDIAMVASNTQGDGGNNKDSRLPRPVLDQRRHGQLTQEKLT